MSMPVEQIAAQLGFTLEELALNRAGELSSHQSWQSVKAAITMSLFALMALGIVAVVVFIVKPTGFMRVMMLVLSLGATAFCAMFAWRTVAAAVSHKVLVAEGLVEFRSGSRQSTIVVVGAFRSTVDNAHKALTPGEPYRVYYLDHSGDLLSIEPLGSGGGNP